MYNIIILLLINFIAWSMNMFISLIASIINDHSQKWLNILQTPQNSMFYKFACSFFISWGRVLTLQNRVRINSFTQYVFLFFKKVNILRLTGKKRWVHVVSLTELKYYFLASRLWENLINIQWNISVEKGETIWSRNKGIFEAKFRLLKCITNQTSFLKS